MSAEEFWKNALWKKKMQRELKIRDLDGDGFVSKADYDLVIQRYRELGAPEKRLEKMTQLLARVMKSMGIDGTTKLTLQECSKNFEKSGTKPEDLDEWFMIQFKILDTNGDGEISFKEWSDYYTVVGIDTVHARPSFDAMDTDGDGVISKEEFLAFIKEFYFSKEDKLKSSIMYGPLD